MICPLKLISTTVLERSKEVSERDPYYIAHLQCEDKCAWLIEHIYETPTCAIKALAFTLNEVFDVLIEEAGENLDQEEETDN